MEIFSWLLLLLAFMTSLAALGTQTHPRPGRVCEREGDFTRLGKGPALAAGFARLCRICCSIPALLGEGEASPQLQLLDGKRFPPNSQ